MTISPTPTVTLGANTYEVYGDLADADIYLAPAMAADAWRTADNDTKGRALVTSTRWLDSQDWQGERTSDLQELDWPRTGIAGVSDSDVPIQIINASFELAAALVAEPTLQTSLSDAKLRSISAGSVSLEYFRGESVQVTTPFPKIIMDLVGAWLIGSSTGVAGALSFGTCEPNPLETKYDFS